MADVRDAIVKVQAIARALTGMKEAPDDARGAMNAYPFAVSYMRSARYELESGVMKGIYRLATDIHMASEGDLQQAVKYLSAYGTSFPLAMLKDPTLGGTISTMVTGKDGPPITSTFRSWNYNSVQTLVLGFETVVKIENVIPT